MAERELEDGMIPDLKGVTPPGIVKPGYYKATIEDAGDKISQSGNKMLNVKFSLDGDGSIVYECFVYSQPIAMKRLKELVLAAGLDADGGFAIIELLDAKLGILVTYDSGSEYPRAKKFLPVEQDVEWQNEDIPF